jgi:NADPH-dependent 2,4-dienoyl-CoA reductase/sulfur reductase-like enzyme
MSEPSLAFDVLVIGGGPGGLAAACAAAESGQRVGLVDESPSIGGQIWRGEFHKWRKNEPDGRSSAYPSAPQHWFERFQSSGAVLQAQTAVIAAPEPGVLLVEKDFAPCQLRWSRLVLATGARELFLPFPGWTLPGVVGPGGLQSLVKGGWPISGARVILAGSGPLLLAVAAGLKRYGARIAGVFEQASFREVSSFGMRLWRWPAKLLQAGRLRLSLLGVTYSCGVWPVGADGKDRVQQVTLTDGRKTWTEACDYLACGFGLVPNVELPLLLGCELRDGFVAVDSFQATAVSNVYCAGEPTGIGGADCALVEGQIAGFAAAGQATKAEALLGKRGDWHRFRRSMAKSFALRPELKSLATDSTVVCRCEDVTFGQMRAYNNWREAKLQTRCGMGACQGRTCGAAAKFLLGWGMESVRPPIMPASITSLIATDLQLPAT